VTRGVAEWGAGAAMIAPPVMGGQPRGGAGAPGASSISGVKRSLAIVAALAASLAGCEGGDLFGRGGGGGVDPTPDSGGGPMPDPDAGRPRPDASAPPPDSGSDPRPDAGSQTPDARPTPDAGPPPPDSGGGGLNCRNAASWPAEWVALEDETLRLINQRRAAGATCGGVTKPPVAALTMNAELREAARCHSLDMAVNNYFSHDSQDGRSPWDRIAEAGYTGNATGENIAAGYGTAERTVSGWMSSTGHCNNIMNGNSTETGVGYGLHDGSDFGNYWTQTFGRR